MLKTPLKVIRYPVTCTITAPLAPPCHRRARDIGVSLVFEKRKLTLLPVMQLLDQSHMRMLIDNGMPGDHVMQMLIQGQSLVVLACHIQRDLCIAVTTRLLLC